MADKKISELVSLAGKDVAANDLFPVVGKDVAETKSLTRDELRNAVNAIQFAATKALATTAAASLPDDTIIEVAADESLSDARTRYTVAAGALVFAVNLDQLQVDLADASDPAKGAALVGFLQSGTGASGRSLSDSGIDHVSVFDFMTAAERLDVRSCAASIDVTAKINAAIAEMAARGGGTVTCPSGKMLALGIQMKPKVTLDARRTEFVKNGGAASTHIIEFNGALSVSTALTAIADKGALSVEVTSTDGLTVGDWVMLYDNTYKYSVYGRNQEFSRIAGISGLIVTLSGRTIGSYATASSATLVKVLPCEGAKIIGGKWTIPVGVAGGNIYGSLAINCTVTESECVGPNDDAGISFDSSTGINVSYCLVRDAQNVSLGGFGYGYILGGSCYACSMHHNKSVNVREDAFTDNTRYSSFHHHVSVGAYDNAFNTHGTGCDGIDIHDLTIISPIGRGICVGYSTHPAGDRNITISRVKMINVGSVALSIAAPPSGLLNNNGVRVECVTVDGYSLVTAGANGVTCSYSDDVRLSEIYLDGKSSSNPAYGFSFAAGSRIEAIRNKVKGLANGYGYSFQSVVGLKLIENDSSNVSSFNFRETVACTNVLLKDNTSDDTSFSLIGTSMRRVGNTWGVKADQDNGVTSVADGGTITHKCVATPTQVRATPTVAGELVSVVAKAGTTFTVAIKKHDGTPGTTQDVSWEASV